MNILVTGATGFIGKRLTLSLFSKGHKVTCLVRKTSKTAFLKEKGIPLVYGDITDAESVRRAMREIKPDAICHSAALVMSRDEKALYKANVEGTRNVCEAAIGNNVGAIHELPLLVYLSSVAVISGNNVNPLTDDLPYSANNAYGRSKIAAEQIVIDFRGKGLRSAIIRPCIVYGEGEPHFFDAALRNIAKRRVPLPNIPETSAKIQMVYVGNVVRLMETVLEKFNVGAQRAVPLQGTFISADKEIMTMKSFLETLYAEMGVGKPPVIPRWIMNMIMAVPPLRKRVEYFFRDRTYDISRAREVLGYVPEVSTREGLHRTIEWWKSK